MGVSETAGPAVRAPPSASPSCSIRLSNFPTHRLLQDRQCLPLCRGRKLAIGSDTRAVSHSSQGYTGGLSFSQRACQRAGKAGRNCTICATAASTPPLPGR
jgi:hypothetical protein